MSWRSEERVFQAARPQQKKTTFCQIWFLFCAERRCTERKFFCSPHNFCVSDSLNCNVHSTQSVNCTFHSIKLDQTMILCYRPAGVGRSTHTVPRPTYMWHSLWRCDNQTDNLTSSWQYHQHLQYCRRRRQHSSSVAPASQLLHLNSKISLSIIQRANRLIYNSFKRKC